MANTVALQEGALIVNNTEDRDVVGQIKGLGLKLLPFPGIYYTSYRMER